LCEIASQSSKKSPREIKSLLLKLTAFFFALLIVILIAGARTADKYRGLSEEEAAAKEVVTPVLKEIVEIDEFVFVEETLNDDMRKKNTVCLILTLENCFNSGTHAFNFTLERIWYNMAYLGLKPL